MKILIQKLMLFILLVALAPTKTVMAAGGFDEYSDDDYMTAGTFKYGMITNEYYDHEDYDHKYYDLEYYDLADYGLAEDASEDFGIYRLNSTSQAAAATNSSASSLPPAPFAPISTTPDDEKSGPRRTSSEHSKARTEKQSAGILAQRSIKNGPPRAKVLTTVHEAAALCIQMVKDLLASTRTTPPSGLPCYKKFLHYSNEIAFADGNLIYAFNRMINQAKGKEDFLTIEFLHNRFLVHDGHTFSSFSELERAYEGALRTIQTRWVMEPYTNLFDTHNGTNAEEWTVIRHPDKNVYILIEALAKRLQLNADIKPGAGLDTKQYTSKVFIRKSALQDIINTFGFEIEGLPAPEEDPDVAAITAKLAKT